MGFSLKRTMTSFLQLSFSNDSFNSQPFLPFLISRWHQASPLRPHSSVHGRATGDHGISVPSWQSRTSCSAHESSVCDTQPTVVVSILVVQVHIKLATVIDGFMVLGSDSRHQVFLECEFAFHPFPARMRLCVCDLACNCFFLLDYDLKVTGGWVWFKVRAD